MNTICPTCRMRKEPANNIDCMCTRYTTPDVLPWETEEYDTTVFPGTKTVLVEEKDIERELQIIKDRIIKRKIQNRRAIYG